MQTNESSKSPKNTNKVDLDFVNHNQTPQSSRSLSSSLESEVLLIFNEIFE